MCGWANKSQRNKSLVLSKMYGYKILMHYLHLLFPCSSGKRVTTFWRVMMIICESLGWGEGNCPQASMLEQSQPPLGLWFRILPEHWMAALGKMSFGTCTFLYTDIKQMTRLLILVRLFTQNPRTRFKITLSDFSSFINILNNICHCTDGLTGVISHIYSQTEKGGQCQTCRLSQDHPQEPSGQWEGAECGVSP